MKNIKYYIFIIVLAFIYSCEFQENINIVQYNITGKIINVNNPTQFDGKNLYLESSYYSATEGTVRETIAETVVSDSGKFEINYESAPGNSLTIRCIEFIDFNKSVPINKNITPVFYVSDSATLFINFTTNNTISSNDTLYIRYTRPSINEPVIEYLVGPLSNSFNITYRGYNYGSYNFTYGRGLNDLKNNGHLRYKNYILKGDPFIDSVVLKY